MFKQYPYVASCHKLDIPKLQHVLADEMGNIFNFRRRLAVDGPSQQMQMSMLQQVAPQQEDHTQSRAVALHNVESTISELSGIFTNLASMVVHQGELAIRFVFFFSMLLLRFCRRGTKSGVKPFFGFLS